MESKYMKTMTTWFAFALCLPALTNAQTGSICTTLESNIDAELRVLALTTAMSVGDSAPRATMQAAQQSKSWQLIRAAMDQMRDNKCRTLSYAVTSEPYGSAALSCALAIFRGDDASTRLETCDLTKWKRDKASVKSPG